jgi:hypothetical protein
MPKLKLLILDAGVVIYLHELGLWSKVVASCDLYLSRIVAEKEVLFQKSERDEYGYDIDLSPMITAGATTVFDVSVSDLKTFRNQFDLLYLGDLDDGEAESLAYLVRQSPDFLISSGDAIVYRVLGNLNRGEQGIADVVGHLDDHPDRIRHAGLLHSLHHVRSIMVQQMTAELFGLLGNAFGHRGRSPKLNPARKCGRGIILQINGQFIQPRRQIPMDMS